MKLLLISSKNDVIEDISKVTGVGRYVREIYEGLKGENDVSLYPLFDYSSNLSSFVSVGKGIIRNYSDYDIIHLLSPKPFFPIRRGKAKWVTTVHDLFFLRYKESKPSPLMQKVYLKSILSSDAVIAVSSIVKEDIEKLSYNKRIFVVNPGVEEKFFTTPSHKTRKSDVIRFGYIGRLDAERKDIIRGIKMFRKIRERKIIFELWGSYDPNSEIFKEIKKESKEDPRIRIMGPALDEKLIEIYDTFDAFFFPTKEEGFGLPIVEAQTRGVPVIVFNDARIPQEVCKDCIKIRNEFPSLEYILSFSEKYCNRLKNNMTRFYWRNSIKSLISIYNSLII
ncbi:Glycosyltransferase Gtf1 [Sulfuracidifex tepidarius]|uniref:Glycosyltransferase Gtf1 n=1 Tax=Sulfuracidifex tepidarius TaxID=1294262 RepID=A0A510DSQ9_9CREN|nr:glycosyltransferase [Sulfuracidifex tepidarius]BBG23198.1 Glycosyltransferase Gtf1 [Sulfuracidifex tepidarius]